MKLCLFDFDGTLTTKDTLIDFLFFSETKSKVVFAFIYLLPFIIGWKLNLVTAQALKEKLFTFFWKNSSVKELETKGIEYVNKRLPLVLQKNVEKKILELKKDNYDIYVVTASPYFWILPWCKNLGLHLICTKLETKNNVFTGKIDGKNCNGIEKVKRIKESINLSNYSKIIAFGNSKGDLPMLELADKKFYKEIF